MQSALDNVSDAIESYLSSAMSSVRHAAERVGMREIISQKHLILADIYRLHPIASSVMLVGYDGIIHDVAPALDKNLIGSSDCLGPFIGTRTGDILANPIIPDQIRYQHTWTDQ